MAEVFLARDQLLDRPVAVKVLFPEFATDPSFVERFRREARPPPTSTTPTSSASTTGARRTAPTSSSWSTSRAAASPRSSAPTARCTPTGPPRSPPTSPPRSASPTATASSTATSSRATSSSPPTGQVKVADFGIARAINAGAEREPHPDRLGHGHGHLLLARAGPGPRRSTPAATSTRSASCSTRWSPGRPPFSGDSPVAIAYKHVQEPPTAAAAQVAAAVPAGYEAITLKLLAKNPADRYATAPRPPRRPAPLPRGQPLLAESRHGRSRRPPRPQLTSGPARAVPGRHRRHRRGPRPTDPAPPGTPASDHRRRRLDATAAPAGSSPILSCCWPSLGGLLFRLRPGARDLRRQARRSRCPTWSTCSTPAAKTTLENNGLKSKRVDVENEKPLGTVIAQNPKSKAKADEDSVVTLTVSTGPGMIVVPDGLVGQDKNMVDQRLRAAGFTNISYGTEFSDERPDNTVISTDPAANASVPKGSLISVVLSSGPERHPIDRGDDHHHRDADDRHAHHRHTHDRRRPPPHRPPPHHRPPRRPPPPRHRPPPPPAAPPPGPRRARPSGPPVAAQPAAPIHLAVAGAHLQGQPLEPPAHRPRCGAD